MASPYGENTRNKAVSDFWERIEFLVGAQTIKEFCKKSGIIEGSLQSAKSRNTMPRESTLEKWAEGIGCSSAWLIRGVGEPFPSDIPPLKKGFSPTDTADLDYETLVSAIETIEIYLRDEQLVLDPSNKARAIAGGYGIFASDMEIEQAKRSVASLLHLA